MIIPKTLREKRDHGRCDGIKSGNHNAVTCRYCRSKRRPSKPARSIAEILTKLLPTIKPKSK